MLSTSQLGIWLLRCPLFGPPVYIRAGKACWDATSDRWKTLHAKVLLFSFAAVRNLGFTYGSSSHAGIWLGSWFGESDSVHFSRRELQWILGKMCEQPGVSSTGGPEAGLAAPAVLLETKVCRHRLCHWWCWKPHGKELLTKSGQHRAFHPCWSTYCSTSGRADCYVLSVTLQIWQDLYKHHWKEITLTYVTCLTWSNLSHQRDRVKFCIHRTCLICL